MKKCINCGEALEDDARFCSECGSVQPEESSSTESSTSKGIGIEDCMVEKIDEKTIMLNIKGISMNLKLVEGNNYGTDKELLDFYLGETPVTQAFWLVLKGDNPSSDISDLNFPVTNITPTMVTSFFVKLNQITGIKFELPTKEQWDFAYRGGNQTKGFKYSGSNDLSEVGWDDKKLHPVGELYANELGLYDMEGNIEELLKGGKQAFISKNVKDKLPDDNLTGFRIVINIPIEEKIKHDSVLSDIIYQQQKSMIALRDEAIAVKKEKEEEEKRKAEEEAKRKAEEEAKKKAEKEAKRKAEEEAKKLAEEEKARKKAEEEERKRNEAKEKARKKAELEAKKEAEKEEKIKTLRTKLSSLEKKNNDLKNSLDSINPSLKADQKLIADEKELLKKYKEQIRIQEEKLEKIEKRYNVVLLKRVDNGLFNFKGNKFDEVLMNLTSADKTQIKEWNSLLKNKKRVVLMANSDKAKAESWKSTIDDAGGEAIIETTIEDRAYQEQKVIINQECKNIKENISHSENSIELLKEKIDQSRKKIKKIEEEYNPIHLQYNKCVLEIEFLESGKSVKNFLKERCKFPENLEALSSVFPKEYTQFQNEQFISDHKDKNGYIRYSKNEVSKFYEIFLRLCGEDYKKKLSKINTLKDEALNESDKKNLSWNRFGKLRKEIEKYGMPEDPYKGKIEFIFLNKQTLVIRGKGEMPHLYKGLQGINVKGNYWEPNEEIDSNYDIKNIIVTGEIKTIGINCFNGWPPVEFISLPESIEKIDSDGCSKAKFCDLSNLKKLRLIQREALSGLDQEYIFVPENVEKISELAFGNLESNKKILFICEKTKIIEESNSAKVLSKL